MRIIFMGTPAFSIPTLEILINSGHEIAAVITATDKLGGRGGKQLIESDVKKYAIRKNLKVLQPKNLKSNVFNEELKALKADIQVVVAFRMLPEMVWNMPPLGTINLHGSLLPKYRGAAPINWAIMSGELETGVTAFRLKHEIDTGDIILSRLMKIHEDDTAGSVHDRMMYLGAQAVSKAISQIETESVNYLSQKHEDASPAPKLNTENTKINYDNKSKHIYDFVRGLSPYPTAWTDIIANTKMKVFKISYEVLANELAPGSILTDNKSYIKIATKDGYVLLMDIQMAGKKRMRIKDFLNGFNID